MMTDDDDWKNMLKICLFISTDRRTNRWTLHYGICRAYA